MKIVKITNEQIERAKKLYPFDNLKGSITEGKSNLYGALGEIIVNDYFTQKGLTVDFSSTYDYDMKIEGYKVDVKTKRTTVIPKPNYLCSISSWNTKQKCDFYFFLRIDKDLKEGYLLGYKRKEVFFTESTFNEKGSEDTNGWKFKSDCYNLSIGKLDKFKKYTYKLGC